MPWTIEELREATASTWGIYTAAGQWFTLRRKGTGTGDALPVEPERVYDLTLAGNAWLVLEAASELGLRRQSTSQQLRLAALCNAACAAMESGAGVAVSFADVVELELATYVDRDDFDALIAGDATDKERGSSLCVFGSIPGMDTRA